MPFTVHFDDDGDVVKVDPPAGKKIKHDGRHDKKHPVNNCTKMKAVHIICKPGNSACCIVQAGRLICWC
jgi:hypothetical protein